MARLWFVSDYLPFPSNNGVSLPLANLLTGLQQTYDVSFLYLDGASQGKAERAVLDDNAARVDLHVATVIRQPALRRAFGELSMRAPFFHGFDLDRMTLPEEVAQADAYLFSPFTALAVAKHGILSSSVPRVAWINDSVTAMLRSRVNYLAKKGIDPRKRLHLLSQWLRSWYMGRLEAGVLADFDIIYVQTETERTWLNRISNGNLTSRTKTVTNGVNDILFSRPIETPSHSVLFFGDMTGVYNDIVIWLLKQIWPLLRERIPDVTLSLIGKGASGAVLRMVEQDDNVDYQSYVADIVDVFDGKGVMLAPVFKDYGVINKVLESMAAGVPVVGDRTAFNGIAAFQPDLHALVADTPVAMAAAVARLLDDSQLYDEVAQRARELMRRDFSWSSRLASVRRDMDAVLPGAR